MWPKGVSPGRNVYRIMCLMAIWFRDRAALKIKINNFFKKAGKNEGRKTMLGWFTYSLFVL